MFNSPNKYYTYTRTKTRKYYKKLTSHGKMTFKKLNQKDLSRGFATVEYIMLVTAIITALLAFLASPMSVFRVAFDSTLMQAADGMDEMSERQRNSFPVAPTPRRSPNVGAPPAVR